MLDDISDELGVVLRLLGIVCAAVLGVLVCMVGICIEEKNWIGMLP